MVPSTDMFLSAKSRVFNPLPVIIPEKNSPEGNRFSPHVISLWDKKSKKNNIPPLDQKYISPALTQETETLIQKRLDTKLEKINKTESSEKNTKNTQYLPNDKNSKKHEEEVSEKEREKLETFSVHHMPESEIKVPSREDQISKVKKAMNQFEALKKTSSGSDNKGFFRNLKNLL